MQEKEFRERIARIQRVQNIEEATKSKIKEEKTKKKDISGIMPVIGGVKKNIENFRKSKKETIQDVRNRRTEVRRRNVHVILSLHIKTEEKIYMNKM